MGHQKGYRMKIENTENQTLILDMWDNLSYIDGPTTTTFTYLEGAETPLKLSVIDNDEDRFTTIRAQQLEINFLSTPQTDLSDFTEGPDNRWFTELSFLDPDGTTMHRIFTGFISLSDMQQDFLSDPNTLTLTAYDGIGALKDLPLVDYNGANPKGKYSLIQYLSFALVQTGLYLPINIANSLWAQEMIVQGGQDLGWFYTMLDAKTFEDQINTSVNCYEVLQRILSEDCTLFQYGGEWYVVRIEEMDGRGLMVYRFSWNGDYISKTTRATWERDIYVDGQAFFSGEKTSVTFERPLKSVKENFQYSYPLEIIDNIDFSRGTQDMALNPPLYAPIEGIDYPTGTSPTGITTKAFHLDDWTLWEYQNSPTPVAPHASAFIKRVYEDSYEKSRYVVITPGAFSGTVGLWWTYQLSCNRFPINKKDKFTLSMDVRFRSDISGALDDMVAIIALYGNDGSIWEAGNDTPDGDNGAWKLTPSGGRYVEVVWRSDEDLREWKTATVNAGPAPVDGEIEIFLIHYTHSDTWEKHFSNISLDFKAYINGSYQKYNGQYFKVGQATANQAAYRATRETDVYLNDTPQRLFKGALFRKVTVAVPPPGSGFVIDISPTTKWRDNSNASFTDYKPYGWWMAFARWNQHLRTMRLFDVSVQGIYGQQFMGLIHLFNMLDSSPNTIHKQFLLLHYDMDLQKCEWSAVMAEVVDFTMAKTYSETGNSFEFKYYE